MSTRSKGMRPKNRTQRQTIKQNNHNEDAYDLDANMIKARRHSSRGGCYTTSVTHESLDQQPINSNYANSQNGTYAGGDDSKFNRLDDKIDKLSYNNDTAHTDLRKELEAKIDKKLPTQWYTWTVAALVVIVGIIYTLSYRQIIDKVDQYDGNINNIMQKINKIEDHNEQRDVKINEILNKIDTK